MTFSVLLIPLKTNRDIIRTQPDKEVDAVLLDAWDRVLTIGQQPAK